jgi:isoquinoline 1-oxidoreductase beta subunit
MTKRIDRRTFLKITSLASGGLMVSFAMPVRAGNSIQGVKETEVVINPILTIGADNSITIVISKVEMGQGINTTLPMLVAEELDCEWTNIKVVHAGPGGKGDFNNTPPGTFTGGSETTSGEFDKYRRAGATARTMLVQAAARKLNVPVTDCKTKDGYVIAGTRQIAYGELAQAASALTVPEVKLRDPSQWRLIGKSRGRIDIKEKVNGTTLYGIDIMFPGLLTAVVYHPPVFGAKVKSIDDRVARSIPGVVEVIEIPSGVAVIANHFWAAKTGRDQLKIEWDYSSGDLLDSNTQYEEYKKLATEKGATVFEKGDVDAALKNSAKTVEAEFVFPYLAHAPMEPLNCTVKITENGCEVWASTQSPILHQVEIATFLDLPPENVRLHTPAMGGSFGRRGSFSGDWLMEGVHIAKKSGKAIKLIWTREDDITGGFYRPVYVHKVSVGVDRSGYPLAWRHNIVGQSLFVNTTLESLIVSNGIDYSCVTDGAPYANSLSDFRFELTTTTNKVPVLPWRSVGNTHTAFVMETMIDQLATQASIDPVEYRKRFYEKSPGHKAVLDLVVEKSKWTTKLAKDRYRGIAVHAAMGSYVAQVVEIALINGKIKVVRVVCAIDCGLAVNPEGVRAQIEGGIVYGLTAAIHGEITFEEGRVKQKNFNDYKMVRMNQSPEMEVHIVNSSAKMGGAGEPGVPPIAPALANAIFAATGQRSHKLPLRIEGFSF